MATNIPPHNLREAIDATVAYIDDPTIDVAGLMKHIKGPDFPTGGIIVGWQGIKDAYETGRGRVVIRARAHIEPLRQGKEAIIVTEMPYQVSKGDGRNDGSGLIKKIAEVVQNGKVKEISDLRDESDKSGIRLVIELKRDAIPKVVLNKLYKHTPLQTTFGVNMVALVDGVPRTLVAARDHHELRRPPARGRRAPHQARAAPARGARCTSSRACSIALDRPRRGDRADPRLARPRRPRATGLMEQFELSRDPGAGDPRPAPAAAHRARGGQDQAGARRPGRADQGAARDPRRRGARARPDQGGAARDQASATATSAARRSPHSEDEIDIEDLIADQQMVIAITKSGYIKSLPLATYRQQKRGGVGVTGMDMKDEDYIEHLFVCSTHDYLLFFTNRGKVYRQKVYELPEAVAHREGPRAGERAAAARGRVRAGGARPRATSPRASTSSSPPRRARSRRPSSSPTTRRSRPTASSRSRSATTTSWWPCAGPAATTTSSWSRARARPRASTRTRRGPMGRDTGGVRGMNVSRGDNCVLAMDVVQPTTPSCWSSPRTATASARRSRTTRCKGRGAMGVKTIGLTEKKGGLAGALIVREHQDLVFISQNGMVQRTGVQGHLPAGPPGAGRAGDEHPRGRHGQRRGAGDGGRGRHLRPSCEGDGDGPSPVDEVEPSATDAASTATATPRREPTPVPERVGPSCSGLLQWRTRERRWSELE